MTLEVSYVTQQVSYVTQVVSYVTLVLDYDTWCWEQYPKYPLMFILLSSILMLNPQLVHLLNMLVHVCQSLEIGCKHI